MSRNFRGRGFQPRWGIATLRDPKPDIKEQVAYLNRVVKRANKAVGYDTAKKPNEWIWRVVDPRFPDHVLRSGSVVALTRSEARAKIKQVLGLGKKKRLPTDVQIQKGEQVE